MMPPHKSSLEVLYEDNHLIAVFKPPRLLTQGDSSGDKSLMDITKEHLKQKYRKKGQVFLGLLHRLDRPAQGVVLFAKTSKGASRLSEQLRNFEVKKTYEALVEGKLKNKQAHLQDVLAGKNAELDYRVLGEGSEQSLLEIRLKTGRKHQIRKQLSQIGHPVVGDIRYGSKVPYSQGAISLCARRMEFNHPTDKEKRISVEIPKNLCKFEPR